MHVMLRGRTLAHHLTCNRQGFSPNSKGTIGPDKRPRSTPREGCKATILIKMEKSGEWVVKDNNRGVSNVLRFLPNVTNFFSFSYPLFLEYARLCEFFVQERI
ncbi:hypothetical protein ACH5RR_027140 [Cinchona calisaya]|uniref:FAR1 domain-containing protein n=1 Tax=Cinchona calisaya TaxID=153742 RepID=A0ABD2Z4L6_9GENT